MKRRILIVEPQLLLSQGLAALLNAEDDFRIVAQAGDGQQAVHLAAEHVPDMLIIDLHLPGLSGIETISTLKRRQPHLQVLVLTHAKSENEVREALTVGVAGYVLKDSSFEDLLHALRSVARGKTYLSSDVSSQVVNRFLRPNESPASEAPWAQLTRRERSILQLVAEGRTNRVAAELLHVSPKTVEKHRANVMRKLQIGSVSELTLIALEMGLIQRPGSVARAMSTPDATP